MTHLPVRHIPPNKSQGKDSLLSQYFRELVLGNIKLSRKGRPILFLLNTQEENRTWL